MAKHAHNSAFDRLVTQLSRLPGIGSRSAERIAFHLLRQSEQEAIDLAEAIKAFKRDLKVCDDCGNVSESQPCPICQDESRNRSMILVVEQPSDIVSLQQTGSYNGLYHVLMGRLAPLEGIMPGDLNIQPLLERVKNANPPITEVVLGLNPTLEGDGTTMYLAEALESAGIKVTRLARGLPAGAALTGLSKAVLSDALQGRSDVPY
ncbi:recombination mediator RecR [Poriferisphaera sp. WC338]|uniref:recombination mediator RecR n=1 Tax=Poriferisphaera sp. WC338 TaxID=3425129 RepID=UPI003D81AFAF